MTAAEAYNPFDDFAKGVALQQSFAEQQRQAQVLQQNQQRIGMEQQRIQVESQLAKHQQLMNQQRMEITAQYHQQQLALNQQKLEEAKRMNDQKIQQVIRQQDATAKYNQFIQDGLAAGGEIGQLQLQGLAMFPEMYSHVPAGLTGALQKSVMQQQNQAFKPSEFTLPSGDTLIEMAPGKFEQKHKATEPKASAASTAMLRKAMDDVSKIALDLRAKPEDPELKKAIKEAKERANDLAQGMGEPFPYLDVSLLPAAERKQAEESAKNIKIVRDPNTGRLVVTGTESPAAATIPVPKLPKEDDTETERRMGWRNPQ